MSSSTIKNILTNIYVEHVLLIVAGCVSLFAFAPFTKPIFIIISILILLSVIYNKPNTLPKLRIISYGYAYALAYFATQLYWIFYSLYKVIDAGAVLSVIAMLGFSLFLASYVVAAIFCYIRFKTKSEFINLVVFFPSLWTVFEWLRGGFLGGFPWCEVGYTQVDTEFFRGFYPLFGNYSVTFLCLTFIGIIFLILKQKNLAAMSKERHIWQFAIVYCAVILLLGTFLGKIEYTTPYGKPTSIALIQGNILETVKWSSDETLNVYAKAVANTKADIIMIPETGIAQFEYQLPKGYLNKLESEAKQNNASLVLGMPIIIDKKNNYVNAAILLTAPGRPYYAKYHLVPYGEYIPVKWLMKPIYAKVSLPMVDFTPGASYQKPLVASNQKLALDICYENGFSSELLKAAANSTVMVNLSDMVWYGSTIAMDEHLQLSQARALENQRYFVQVTNTGLTAVINPQGQIQSKLEPFKRLTLHDYVQGRVGTTPFERYSNYPIIIFCLVLIILILLYKRT